MSNNLFMMVIRILVIFFWSFLVSIEATSSNKFPVQTRSINGEQTNDARTEWMTSFCEPFYVWSKIIPRHYAAYYNDDSCYKETAEKLKKLLDPSEHFIIFAYARQCIQSGISYSNCVDLVVTGRKKCWRLPQLILLLVQLRQTSAAGLLNVWVSNQIKNRQQQLLSFDEYLIYRKVPKLIASLCVFEITRANQTEREIFKIILAKYAYWQKNTTGNKGPGCHCSEVLTIRISFYQNYYSERDTKLIDEMAITYRGICLLNITKPKKIGNWTVSQLEHWRSPILIKSLRSYPTKNKSNVFSSPADWLGPLPTQMEDSRLLFMVKDSFNKPQIMYAFFEAGFGVDDVKTAFITTNVLEDLCKRRVLTEILFNPKFVQDKSDYTLWHNNLKPFNFAMKNFVQFATEEVEYYRQFNRPIKVADCDYVLWYYKKLQEIYYQMNLGAYGVNELLRVDLVKEYIYSGTVVAVGQTSLEDKVHCLGAVAKIERLVREAERDAAEYAGVPYNQPSDMFRDRIMEFRRSIFKSTNRFLCYQHSSFYESHAREIYYYTDTCVV